MSDIDDLASIQPILKASSKRKDKQGFTALINACASNSPRICSGNI